ncbi:MAG: HindVP family restriction endonuclease [Acidaminococcales bacterium]|jgi:hypothetical protein|nr:HindVP family restriction endonuclease [Acidaminococcales bacterium]
MPKIKKENAEISSGLFGIKHSNRTTDMHWGKNCFNSSFPTSVACYMLANNIPAIYNRLIIDAGELRVAASDISLRDVFNCGNLPLDELDFRFESKYEPYQIYSFDTIDAIDLVIKTIGKKFLSPLEIKLTVLPTSNTSTLPENEWGCELVVRSATTSYCALGMFDSVRDDAPGVREIFEKACADIGSWTNDFEMRHKTPALSESINAFQRKYLNRQKSLLVQTIWKTQGQSPTLADNAFDIVVWSDYAFSRLFIDNATTTESTMSRPMRASAKLARCLWELSKSGKIRLGEIYRQMAFDNQTDKEFAIQGAKWRSYVSSKRIIRPILHKSVVEKIIELGYIEKLRPERRFDQTLYFMMRR